MSRRLFVLKSIDSAGAENYLLRYLSFDDNKDNVVLCTSGKAGQLFEAYSKLSRVVTNIPVGMNNPLQLLKFYLYLKRERFDVICAMNGNLSGWMMWCAKKAGIKKRIAFYRESQNKFKPTLLRRLYARAITSTMYRNTTKILANSKAALVHFHPGYLKEPNKFRVIYNGFDPSLLSHRSKSEIRRLLNIPESAFVVGHSGRLAPAKNHDMIISCAIEMCNRHDDCFFVLIGRGVKEKYSERIKNCHLDDQIKLLGYRDDGMDILKSLDLFYFPSLTEGQPNALIEAMCSGLFFVASDIPSIRETIPTECLESLASPLNYEENISLLEKAYLEKKENTMRSFPISQWAIERFDASLLFNQFKEELL